jgi:polysaccharide biosynthesis/export protein
MSLAAALGAAQGIEKGADLKRVAIVRGTLSDPKVAIVDFEAIQAGRAPNVRLEPRDIVFVPTGRFGTLAELVNVATNTFARSVGANEGGRAAVPNVEPVRPQLNLSN